MRIALSGATGFLGRHLMGRLTEANHEIHLLTREPVTNLPAGVRTFLWNPPRVGPPVAALEDVDAVIHLAGATINHRWTPSYKALLRSSRIESTQSLVHAMSTQARRPAIFLSASAIGIYGDRAAEKLTESSAVGEGFLADLSVEWEREANLARPLGMRVTTLRTGVVLGRNGGALGSMLPAFKLGVGGKLGSGEQWMSWIHLEDWTAAVIALLGENQPAGPVNLTAPEPVTNAEFTAVLGKVLRRPAFLPVPEFALKMIFGEMSTVLLASQRVLPQALAEAGFSFRYPGLELALRNLLQ